LAYTALYRKFRPTIFSEIVGQEHITRTLRNQIISGRIGHAYLFNGGRGTGKTSAAKVMARAVNCLNPKDGEPCNECEICQAILSGTLADVVEMDAASNNSVDDVRAIRDEVNFLPTVAKFRVYIIDEVHMLSSGAFNALLKTLEEPPQHVKFILATTEPQKIPQTILSRCQRFDFKKIPTQNIISRLTHICKESNINITAEALALVASLAEGALRDAISILERCTQDNIEKIDENIIKDLVGIPKLDFIRDLAKKIVDYDPEGILEILNSILENGKDINNLLWELIKYFKDILVYKATSNLELYNKEEKIYISSISENLSKERLLKIIYDLSELENSIKYSTQKIIMAEVGLIKLCMKPAIQPTIATTQSFAETTPKAIEKAKPTNVSSSPKSASIPAQSISTNGSVPYWNTVLAKLKDMGKVMIYTNLIGTQAVLVNDMTVGIQFKNKLVAFAKNVLEDYNNKALISKLVSEEAGAVMQIKYLEPNSSNTTNEKTGIEILDIPINIIDE